MAVEHKVKCWSNYFQAIRRKGRREMAKEVFALHEDTVESYHAIAERDTEGKQGAYSRGRIVEAKSIAKAIGAILPRAGAEPCTIAPEHVTPCATPAARDGASGPNSGFDSRDGGHVFAIHDALSKADLEYSAYSCNGVNLFGDRKSIDAAARAFHSHGQLDWYQRNLRHWREECGKLHAKLAIQNDRLVSAPTASPNRT